MKCRISACGIVSPQIQDSNGTLLIPVQESVSDRLTCHEPDYRQLINPLQLRRMPRILKMGLAAAQICLRQAPGLNPDAVLVGTGLGCLDNLEKFLLDMIDTDEQVTSVLPFISSTHNAVAAQIAMVHKIHGYNQTYCHRGFSFESALLDALMLIEDGQALNALVGGIDECTSDFVLLHRYLGDWKSPVSSNDLLKEDTPGTIAGEGSVFFMLSAIPAEEKGVSVAGVHTFCLPGGANAEQIREEAVAFLHNLRYKPSDIDLLVTGMNGDNRFDFAYANLMSVFSVDMPVVAFKHLCGEYYTASAFALWVGYSIMLRPQLIPSVLIRGTPPDYVRRLLIHNQIRNEEHAFILMEYEKA